MERLSSVVRSLFWIAVYLGLVFTPLFVLLVGATPPPGGFWWDLAIALGFAGLAMMGVQFVLTARFKRATAPFGIDIIYYFHRYAAVVGFLIVLAHPIILVIEDPVVWDALNPLKAPWEMTAGVGSVIALVVVMLTSLLRKPLRLHYDAWRVVHGALASAAVLLALLHVQGVGVYVSDPWKRLVWGLMTITWIAILAYLRVIKPWRLLRKPYRVASIIPEAGNSWRIDLVPDAHPGFAFAPGQFAWVSLRSSPFAMREHPFSISSSPVNAKGRLGFTIKELGDFTRTLGTVKVGEPAYVDGPYGAFSIDRTASPKGYVFVAGGIGIAPMLSMLSALADRSDKRTHRLFFACREKAQLTGRNEIEALKGRLSLEVTYVLESPPDGWSGAKGRISRDLLNTHLPAARRELCYFICGPEPMIQAAEQDLSALGVPLRRIHSELFDLV